MGIRKRVILTLLLILGLVGVLRTNRRTKVPEVTPSEISNFQTGASNKTTQFQTPSGRNTQAAGSTQPSSLRTDSVRNTGLQALNHVDIEFFGQLLDQDDQPVPDARVTFSIHHNVGFSAGTKNGETKADEKGFFHISGYKGKSLSIIPEKKGYFLAATNASAFYSRLWPDAQRHIPDPMHPTIIRMWKSSGAQELLEINKLLRFPGDSRVILIDLIEGREVTNGGDLKIGVTRDQGIISERQPGDWGISLEAVEGGIIEPTADQYVMTFLAPEDNYVPTLWQTMAKDNKPWHEDIKKLIFLKSRGGKVHAKLHLDFAINLDPKGTMSLVIFGYINPHASRNWEIDPSKLKRIP
jgi:hypothetical protein